MGVVDEQRAKGEEERKKKEEERRLREQQKAQEQALSYSDFDPESLSRSGQRRLGNIQGMRYDQQSGNLNRSGQRKLEREERRLGREVERVSNRESRKQEKAAIKQDWNAMSPFDRPINPTALEAQRKKPKGLSLPKISLVTEPLYDAAASAPSVLKSVYSNFRNMFTDDEEENGDPFFVKF